MVWYATFLSCAFGQGSVSALWNAILPLRVLPQDVEDRTSFSNTFFSSDKVLGRGLLCVRSGTLRFCPVHLVSAQSVFCSLLSFR